MKNVKIKDAKEGDIVIVNKGAFYYEFKHYEKLNGVDTVAVHRFGDVPKYYLSEHYVLDIAEKLEDLLPSKKD